ncbi:MULTISPECIES: MFS transporter [unclassified Devosia]|uniref:MFS transporter n=1 Tax=unclassified Devosia TaxID=196773 RepID=UPI00086D23E9|nr:MULTISPECIES: MFS transporter [unclassified Devosia]MBN9361166.1 MFS transporter [Devosia sp.]ODS85404.1 MAG: MFS transporter [Devosia sp. SCN 66-27]OJX20938.1 MAG: MFS transporter [Devosia sp. 66-14]
MTDKPTAAAWRMLVLLTGAVILSMTTWFSATAILPQLTAQWQLSGLAQTWMTNGVQLGFVAGALSLSVVNLPDIAPLRLLMGIAAALAAVFNLALLLAPSAEVAITLRFLTGIALAGVYPPALKLVATWFVRGRGLAMGTMIGGLTLGSAFPHLLRALFAGLDWRFVVATASGLTLGGAIVFLALVREGPYPFSRAVFDPRQIGRVVRNRAVALANLGYFGHMWELYAAWGWFLAFASAASVTSAMSPAGISLLVFGVVASGIVGCLIGGVLADRIGRTATTIIMMTLSGLCALAIGLSFDGPLWLFVGLAVLWGMTIIADSAQFSAMTTEVGDSDLIGTALAFQLGIGFALTIVSLTVVPMLAAAIGWQWAFAILAPGPLIGIVAMLLLRRLPEAERIAQGRK